MKQKPAATTEIALHRIQKAIRCPQHPRYQAKNAPRCACCHCWALFFHARLVFGHQPVPEPTRIYSTNPVQTFRSHNN